MGMCAEALSGGAWYPGIVRRLVSDANRVLAEVLWDGMAAADTLSPGDVHKPARTHDYYWGGGEASKAVWRLHAADAAQHSRELPGL